MEFTAILGALPTLGPIGLVLIILVYVGRQWVISDARYRAEIDRLNDAHAKELDRINSSHDDELKELRADITELRRDVDALRREVEQERQLRFKAQEEAHEIRIMQAKLQSGTDT